ncbi:tRNA (adenosine(37)-N6)-threonylcarbamoyltransferase complex dimerization subunit type 1 TsaB [Thermodesulfobacteriota bacterium]
MQILAVDTATRSCSVAILSDRDLLAEVLVANGQTHSKHLMQMIKTGMERSGITLSDLDGIAVTRGPGSFTGLRIGISTVKGLAVAIGVPMVGISTLDVLAEQSATSPFLICPLIDARKGEVYFSKYKWSHNGLGKKCEEQVGSLSGVLADIDEPSLFVGDGALLYEELIRERIRSLAHFAAQNQHTILASTVARLGLKRFRQGDIDSLDRFVPRYIRKSDAEIKRKQ